jgi:hypothetical protein
MAMKKSHDAVYAGEKYTDRNGEEKTRYVNIGALFTRDDGSMTAKIESIPVGFNGWVNFYVPKPRDEARAPAAERNSGGASDPNDDIPFAPPISRRCWAALT